MQSRYNCQPVQLLSYPSPCNPGTTANPSNCYLIHHHTIQIQLPTRLIVTLSITIQSRYNCQTVQLLSYPSPYYPDATANPSNCYLIHHYTIQIQLPTSLIAILSITIQSRYNCQPVQLLSCPSPYHPDTTANPSNCYLIHHHTIQIQLPTHPIDILSITIQSRYNCQPVQLLSYPSPYNPDTTDNPSNCYLIHHHTIQVQLPTHPIAILSITIASRYNCQPVQLLSYPSPCNPGTTANPSNCYLIHHYAIQVQLPTRPIAPYPSPCNPGTTANPSNCYLIHHHTIQIQLPTRLIVILSITIQSRYNCQTVQLLSYPSPYYPDATVNPSNCYLIHHHAIQTQLPTRPIAILSITIQSRYNCQPVQLLSYPSPYHTAANPSNCYLIHHYTIQIQLPTRLIAILSITIQSRYNCQPVQLLSCPSPYHPDTTANPSNCYLIHHHTIQIQLPTHPIDILSITIQSRYNCQPVQLLSYPSPYNPDTTDNPSNCYLIHHHTIQVQLPTRPIAILSITIASRYNCQPVQLLSYPSPCNPDTTANPSNFYLIHHHTIQIQLPTRSVAILSITMQSWYNCQPSNRYLIHHHTIQIQLPTRPIAILPITMPSSYKHNDSPYAWCKSLVPETTTGITENWYSLQTCINLQIV
ncbi:hypothetical protein CHS0354_010002 [Potamilus streckersoni]|uniref:Uncharacterized protein n=1 Tax=Potamilus streckersoni TaxID=2493646 RepID=A0AAE0SC70_9BIVA|nr:hypothetical protein CHS0354_010002 [Potamilus streckersoni]